MQNSIKRRNVVLTLISSEQASLEFLAIFFEQRNCYLCPRRLLELSTTKQFQSRLSVAHNFKNTLSISINLLIWTVTIPQIFLFLIFYISSMEETNGSCRKSGKGKMHIYILKWKKWNDSNFLLEHTWGKRIK